VSTNFTQVLGQFLLDDCCMSIFFYLTLCVSVSDSFIHPFDDVVTGCFDDVLSIMIKGKVLLLCSDSESWVFENIILQQFLILKGRITSYVKIIFYLVLSPKLARPSAMLFTS